MATPTFIGSMKEESTGLFDKLFNNDWSPMIAGIFIAFSAIMIAFFADGAWGISAGYKNWGDWILYGIGVISDKPDAPWFHIISLSNLGIIAGAFASALLSRQFKLRTTSKREYAKGLTGGVLMGFGAALTGGCNVGGFYSGIGMFSLGGYAMMAGLGIGAFIGLKLLMWELGHLPSKPKKKKDTPVKSARFNHEKVQPWIGWLIIAAVIGIFYLFASPSFDEMNVADTKALGGVLFFASIIGITMHRSRFCFVRAFRCPLMTGEADMVKVVAFSLLLYGGGVSVLKSLFIISETMGVNQPFLTGSLSGGILFGIGMLLAGGCASSTLWRSAEGHTKLFVTLFSFALTNALSKAFIPSGFFEKLGGRFFIPEIMPWKYSIPVFLSFLMVWVLVAIWNEKTDKFVIF